MYSDLIFFKLFFIVLGNKVYCQCDKIYAYVDFNDQCSTPKLNSR